jgi:hypothetical protein
MERRFILLLIAVILVIVVVIINRKSSVEKYAPGSADDKDVIKKYIEDNVDKISEKSEVVIAMFKKLTTDEEIIKQVTLSVEAGEVETLLGFLEGL